MLVAIGLSGSLAVVGSCGSTAVTSVTPAGVRCAVSLSAPVGTLPGQGGSGLVSVATEPECAWSASATAPWISQITPATGQGAGQVQFAAAPNTAGSARSAQVVVNAVALTIDQAPCGFHVAPLAIEMPAAGGESKVTVTGTRGCTWTAQSLEDWIAIGPGGSGDGDGVVTLQVARTTGKTRTGSVIVAGHEITLVQRAPSLGLLATATSRGGYDRPPPQHPARSPRPVSVSMSSAGG